MGNSQTLAKETGTLARAESELPSKGRVLMVSTAIGVGGGAEEQVMLLSLGLSQRGWEVKIVSLLPLTPVLAELEASAVQIASLGMKPGVPDPRAMFALSKELRSFRPDVVHCHMPQANLLARAVRPFHRFPVLISTLHNLTMEKIDGSSGRYLELAHRWTDRYSDLTTVICTPALRSYVERGAVPANKIVVLHNGVNTRNFRTDCALRERLRRDLNVADKFVWLAIGRLELAKDYPNLIRAFTKAAERTKQELVLLICGLGSLEEQIRAQVRTCGVEDRVKFLGIRKDIPAVMNAADAFVMSSYLEGLPMVLLQASSIGMPIVATDVGGNAEVVMDGVNGFIVPSYDDETLASRMERVMCLPETERSLMAERGRRLARENFEIERILDRWEELYAGQMKRKSGRPIL